MSLKTWFEKRRLKELERINREIETLKDQGPHYLHNKENPHAGIRGDKGYIKRDTNFGFLLLIGLCLIAIIWLSLFYRQKFNDLSDQYNQKLTELQETSIHLSNLTMELNQTKYRLQFKERVESDLSSQYIDLTEQKEVLEKEIKELEADIGSKKTEIENLKKDVAAKAKKINDLKDCILDDDVDDKEDCI